jgi:hypothetical protein
MKKPASKIRLEIARLQDQLKEAETRQAERIGRIAIRAGLGELEIDEGELQAAFEDVCNRFRHCGVPTDREKSRERPPHNAEAPTVAPRLDPGTAGEG